jgi:hypothetical protein
MQQACPMEDLIQLPRRSQRKRDFDFEASSSAVTCDAVITCEQPCRAGLQYRARLIGAERHSTSLRGGSTCEHAAPTAGPKGSGGIAAPGLQWIASCEILDGMARSSTRIAGQSLPLLCRGRRDHAQQQAAASPAVLTLSTIHARATGWSSETQLAPGPRNVLNTG